MYSLIGSAKPNGGLNPELYLRTVRARIADQPTSRIGDQLPWNLRVKLRIVALALLAPPSAIKPFFDCDWL